MRPNQNSDTKGTRGFGCIEKSNQGSFPQTSQNVLISSALTGLVLYVYVYIQKKSLQSFILAQEALFSKRKLDSFGIMCFFPRRNMFSLHPILDQFHLLF